MSRLLPFCLALILSAPVLATNAIDRILCGMILERALEPGYCHANIACLAKTLTEQIPDFDLRRASVLYIFSESAVSGRRKYSGDPIWAWNTSRVMGGSGTGNPHRWNWHVVLEYEMERIPHILDPAYAGFPKFRSTKDYFRDNFLRDEDPYIKKANGDIVIRSIPALYYVRTFEDSRRYREDMGLKDEFYFLDDLVVRTLFPSEPILDFLKRR